MSQIFTLPRLMDRARLIARIASFVGNLSLEKAWVIEVKELKRKRSNHQNAYLWGIVYPAILAHLPGWEAADVHDYCLGECFGWEQVEGLGRKKLKPLKRSSKLSVTEFMDYVAWIQRDMAGRGIYIPDPNEDLQAAA